MSNKSSVTELIRELSGQANTLTIPHVFVKMLGGDINAALLLSQLVYWSDKGKRSDGFFYKSYAEWRDEIGLSQYQVSRAVDKLSFCVETQLKRANCAPTIHYRVNMNALTDSIIKFLDNRKTSQSDCEETSQSDYEETPQSLTETTQQTTPQTTVGASAPPPVPILEICPQPIPEKKKQNGDARSNSAPILCVRGITGRYPPLNLYDKIIDALGDTPNGVLVKACYDAWTQRGYNPQAWTWAIEWYPAGGPPEQNGNGRRNNKGTMINNAAAAIQEFCNV